MKNYYQWFSMDKQLTTQEIQTILFDEMKKINQQKENGTISDAIYIEAINQLRHAQAVFKNEKTRQQYDLNLNQQKNDKLNSKPGLNNQEQVAMNQHHQRKISRFRLWQKLIVLLGIGLTFIWTWGSIGLTEALILMAIILFSVFFVLIVIPIFRKLAFDQRNSIFKFLFMFGLFVLWYFTLHFLLNLVQFNIEDLTAMANQFIYGLLISLIGALVVEWFVFQEEIKYEDLLREWADKQS